MVLGSVRCRGSRGASLITTRRVGTPQTFDPCWFASVVPPNKRRGGGTTTGQLETVFNASVPAESERSPPQSPASYDDRRRATAQRRRDFRANGQATGTGRSLECHGTAVWRRAHSATSTALAHAAAATTTWRPTLGRARAVHCIYAGTGSTLANAGHLAMVAVTPPDGANCRRRLAAVGSHYRAGASSGATCRAGGASDDRSGSHSSKRHDGCLGLGERRWECEARVLPGRHPAVRPTARAGTRQRDGTSTAA